MISRQSSIITLNGSTRRMSRRALLTNMGAAGVGLTILSACGGSSDGGAASTAAPAAEPVDTATADGEDTATADEPADAATADGDDTATSLQLQHVSLGFVSAYVLLRGNEAAVVDTGQSGSADAILEGLGAVGASWSSVKHVVLTHNHGDHTGGLAGVLEQAPGAMVYAGDADLGRIQSSAPLQAVGDGDEVMGLGVLNTPGHTAGSISLFDTESGILVAGDAINGDNGQLTGANEQFSSDLDAAKLSIGKMAALNPTVAAFGHGGAPIDSDVAGQLAALAAD